jgi:hypothetical protein
MRHIEDTLQRAVAQYLDAALPLDVVWWHTPNGGKRNAREAARFKALGVKAGVADIVLVFHGWALAIELKAPKGKTTAAQQQWRDRFVMAGGGYRVCRSLAEVDAELRAWGIPLRGRLMAGGGWVRA